MTADHPFAEREQISLREVCSIPLVMPTEESFLTTNTLKTCAQNKLTPNIMLHTNQIAIVSQLVQNGTAGTLVFHGTLPEFDDVYIYLIWNQYNPLSTALKQLIRATKTVYPQPVVDFYCREIEAESPILNP